MSAQGKWRVSDADLKAYLAKEPTPLARQSLELALALDLADARAVVARAVVVAHNAQCEAEPVAWQWRVNKENVCGSWNSCDEEDVAGFLGNSIIEVRPLYTAPPPPASAAAKVEELRALMQCDTEHPEQVDTAYHEGKLAAADEIIRVLKEAGL